MIEESQLEIVEPGNAKEKTKGPLGPAIEQNPTHPYRPI
jgi:hypothetical protein